MRRPRLVFAPGGLDVVLPWPLALLAPRRRVRVAYAQVAAAGVGPPERAPWLVWRVGAHVPGLLEVGAFRHGGRKRFLVHLPRTRRVLALRLRGHAFDEVSVDLDDPGAARSELAMRAGLPG